MQFAEALGLLGTGAGELRAIVQPVPIAANPRQSNPKPNLRINLFNILFG